MSVENYTRDNLVTSTKKLITDDVLQLESGIVVRGEVLKKGTTGLIPLAVDTDTPYCVSLQNIDASGSAKAIVYTYEGSLLNSEMTYAAGTIANFRDKFISETRLKIEE